MTPTALPFALAVAYVLVVAALALVAWDERAEVVETVDLSRGVQPPDTY